MYEFYGDEEAEYWDLIFGFVLEIEVGKSGFYIF